MPRYKFGANSVVVSSATGLPLADTTGTAYLTEPATTAVTDLQRPDGSALTGVQTDTNGRVPEFLGPNDVSTLWLDFGQGRFLTEATDYDESLAARVANAEALVATVVTTPQLDTRLATERATSDATYLPPAVAAQSTADSKYLKPTAGIPEADLAQPVKDKLGVSGSFDFTTRAPEDGDLPFYSTETGKFSPGPAPQVTTDAYAGRFIIVNPGEEPPADFGAGLVFERSAAAGVALGASETGKSSANSASSLPITLTSAYAVGDYMLLAIGCSGELPAATFSAAVAPVSTAGFTSAVGQTQGTTTQVGLLYARVTTAIASGAVVTISVKDAAGTAVNARNDLVGKAIKLTGVAATSPLDQNGVNGAGSTVSPSVSTGSATTQASEIAVAAFVFNDNVLGFAAGASWTELGTKATTGDAVPRAIAVQFRLVSTVGTVAATASFTRPTGDTTTNTAYSAALQTFKSA